MKGLLLKDYYIGMKSCRTFMAICLIFIVVSAFSSNSFFAFYPALVSLMFGVNIIAYEESSKWTMYVHTLPVSRKMVVDEKYLATAILVGVIMVLSAIAQSVYLIRTDSFSFVELIMILSVIFVVAVVGPAILLPIIFKMGVTKARIYYMVMIGVICALSVLFIPGESGIGMFSNTIFFSFEKLAVIDFAIGIAAYFVSWAISRKIYEKREL